jgi:hypothetical protein
VDSIQRRRRTGEHILETGGAERAQDVLPVREREVELVLERERGEVRRPARIVEEARRRVTARSRMTRNIGVVVVVASHV